MSESKRATYYGLVQLLICGVVIVVSNPSQGSMFGRLWPHSSPAQT